jgi:Spy/CpxP family protein refolding chaperone
MRTHIKIIGLVAIALMAAGRVWAADAPENAAHPKWTESPMGRLILGQITRVISLDSQMSVTPDQRKAILAVIEKHKVELIGDIKVLVANHRELQLLVLSENPSADDIRLAATDFGNAVGDTAVLLAKIHREIAPILTDQQKAALKKYRVDTADAVDQWLSDITPVPK